ncbi:quinone oxidoreductase family protein [Streptomyces sp. LZ34]
MSGTSARALVLDRFGALPRLVAGAVPESRPGHTLVRIQAAQLAHLDLNVIDGEFGILPELPTVPGTTGAGVVLASDTLPEGSPVRVGGQGLGLRRDGCWADHVLVPDAAVEPVPEGTDPALACGYFSPAGTAWAAVHAVAGVRPGERVLVTGAAGAVGALAVQVAARAGAEVVGVVGRATKLGHVPAPATPVLAAELSAEAVGGPVDVLIDTVGGPVLKGALRLVRPRGRAALVGYTAGREFTVDLADFLLADVTLQPVNLMSRGAEVAADAKRLLADLTAGNLTMSIERHPPEALEEAVGRLRSGEAIGKVVLDFG